jgi:hypothetical protein
MQTFLLAALGVIAGLVVLAGGFWLWLRRKLRGLGEAIGALVAGMTVPPFRISLRPLAGARFRAADQVARASQGLTSVGYRPVGDFEVPEMDGVVVRGFWHPRQGSYAALYEHPQAGVVADLVALFRDRSLVTVSTTPETGLDRPSRAPLVRLELDLAHADAASRLHERLLEASGGRTSIRTRPEEFARAFVGAYAMEQDWRIARGGVTAEEVRRAAVAGAQPPPDESAVELVQASWRSAISAFVGDALVSAYAAAHPMASEQRERLRAVHQHSVAADWVDELAWEMIDGRYDADDEEAEDRAFEAAKEQLAAVFASSDVRAAFAEAQPLLPEKRRFERIARVSRPWAGDLYLQPAERAGA